MGDFKIAAIDKIDEAVLASILHEEQKSAAGISFSIIERVREFESALDERHVLSIVVAGLQMIVRNIDGSHPTLILFEGTTMDGQPAQLVQHISQVNVLLIATPLEPAQTKQPIGFQMPPPASTGEGAG